MAIRFLCACGKELKAPDGSGGRKARCPTCQSVVRVPVEEPAVAAVGAALPAGVDEYDIREPEVAKPAKISPAIARVPVLEMPSRPSTTTSRPVLLARVGVFRRFSYVLLLLALIPLVLSTFHAHDTTGDKLDATVRAHPEIAPQLAQLIGTDGTLKATKAELFAVMPNDRLDGSLLAYQTHAHWGIALGAAACFFLFLLTAFPYAMKHAKGLLFAGLFTGTVGIVVLLAFQWAAFTLPWFTPRGAFSIILDIVKLIGLSYSLADGDTGFFLSFLGFTCGVGLCEEITKALPLLLRIKPIPGEEDPTWNGLLLWGLASGIGFGIAEGIMYSGRYYNGVEGAGMYYVRFISCVALHAMWAGAVGVTMYRRQSWLADAANRWDYFGKLVLIVLVPMILHGLYDTLLKQDHDGYALLVAVATFGWLMWQIEGMTRREGAAVTAI